MVFAHPDVPLAQHVTAERRLPDACNPTSTATTGTPRTLACHAWHQATRLLPQINPFGMPPPTAADMLDADHQMTCIGWPTGRRLVLARGRLPLAQWGLLSSVA
jgi:hypothetical protein